MSVKNTPSLPQYGRNYSCQLTAANSNYTTPSNTGLLWTAGPDGSDIFEVAALPYGSQSSINQLQLYASPDGGTTFNLLPLSGIINTFTQGQNLAIPITNLAMPNGVPMGPTNALILAGVTDYVTHSYSQSLISELPNYYRGGISQGTANAQSLPTCFNAMGTALSASPTAGTLVDFTVGPGLTNTTTATIAPGSQPATAIKRGSATALSAGDLTAGFRYRMIFDGTEWLLALTQRLYCAQGQTQNIVVTAWGADR